jgi:hypothetical protein
MFDVKNGSRSSKNRLYGGLVEWFEGELFYVGPGKSTIKSALQVINPGRV